jgi:hypothetical protein
MRRSTLVTLLIVITSTACASAGRGSRQSACALSSADSVYLAGQLLYRDCSVNVRAELLNPDMTPDFSPSGDRSCYSATVQFVVDSTGTPERGTARVVSSNSTEFADALLRVVPQWRYRPARKDGVPVRQIVHEKLAVSLVAVPAGSSPSASGPPRGC